MPKQKIEIELDVPDGWELTGEFRKAEVGEYSITADEPLHKWTIPTSSSYFIVRKKWQWPEWLKAEWIAMDRNGRWFGYDRKPDRTSQDWYGCGGLYTNLLLTDFTPPPCDDWKQSLRRNPNAEVGDGN